jgi:hypothetical protein
MYNLSHIRQQQIGNLLAIRLLQSNQLLKAQKIQDKLLKMT